MTGSQVLIRAFRETEPVGHLQMHTMYRVGVGGRERARRMEGQREVNFKELAHDCGDVGVQPAGWTSIWRPGDEQTLQLESRGCGENPLPVGGHLYLPLQAFDCLDEAHPHHGG